MNNKEVLRMPARHAKLKGRIVEKYGTQKEFASAIGQSENWISNKMNDISPFSKADMEKWANLLDIPQTEFYDYFFT